MKKLIHYFFGQQDQHLYSFFRTAVAIFCFIHFSSTFLDFEMLYAKDGLIPPEVSGLFKLSWIPNFNNLAIFFAKTTGCTYAFATITFKYLYLLSCMMLAAGFLTRFWAFLLLFLHLVLAKGTPFYSYGVDYFTTIALFYCAVFPVGSQHSVDNLIFGSNTANAFPFKRVLQVHLCMVYFFSGFDKLTGYNWRNGEAVWKAIHLPYFNQDFQFNANLFASYPWVMIMVGWATICIELLYPVMISLKKTRPLWLSLTVMMHLGILLYLNLYFFATLMILLNLSAYGDLSTAKKTSDSKSWLNSLLRLPIPLLKKNTE